MAADNELDKNDPGKTTMTTNSGKAPSQSIGVGTRKEMHLRIVFPRTKDKPFNKEEQQQLVLKHLFEYHPKKLTIMSFDKTIQVQSMKDYPKESTRKAKLSVIEEPSNKNGRAELHVFVSTSMSFAELKAPINQTFLQHYGLYMFLHRCKSFKTEEAGWLSHVSIKYTNMEDLRKTTMEWIHKWQCSYHEEDPTKVDNIAGMKPIEIIPKTIRQTIRVGTTKHDVHTTAPSLRCDSKYAPWIKFILAEHPLPPQNGEFHPNNSKPDETVEWIMDQNEFAETAKHTTVHALTEAMLNEQIPPCEKLKTTTTLTMREIIL
jgi:hypothetical protein